MNRKSDRPNLLFVFADQHRCCDLGCYGNDQVQSPHLDAFAKQAVQFDNCIANNPVCVPSRGTLMTGCYPLKHGAVANDLPLKPGSESFGEVLRDHGYHTGYIGKWHLAGVPRDQSIPAGKLRFGFQEWKAANCTHDYMNSYYDDEQNERHLIEGYDAVTHTDLALDFIKRNKGGQPWALALSWGPPHDPYEAVPQRYLDIYRDADIQLRPNVQDEAVLIQGQKSFSREEIKRHHRGYYAHITALDEQFGRLIDTLEQTGQLGNTIVVYTSDHGDMLGSQGQTNKQLPWEESIKVPLLVYWQGRTIRARRDDLITLADLPVSLLGWIGLRFNGQVDGQDLHPLFIDPNAEGLESCYIFDLSACHQAEARGTSEWRGIRTKRYMFARTVYDNGWLLYDNLEDPYQLNNLVHLSTYREIQDRLSCQLNEYINAHDQLAPWAELCEVYGLKEEWNRSQAYFRMPLLE